MRRHNLLHNVQAQPRSARLGGIQRLEDPAQALGWHATARILHLELDAGGGTVARQSERPPRGQGVEGVVHQVEHGAA